MECVRAEKEVLLNHAADRVVAEHLQKCSECRAIADTLAKFIKAKPAEEKYKIPKAIDASITTEAIAFIDERQKGTSVAASPMVRPFHTWATIFAYVACFILIAWMLVIVLSSSRQAKDVESKVNVFQLSEEVKNWDKLDMADELFLLNTEIEINFAALSFSEDSDENGTFIKEQDDNTLEIKIQ